MAETTVPTEVEKTEAQEATPEPSVPAVTAETNGRSITITQTATVQERTEGLHENCDLMLNFRNLGVSIWRDAQGRKSVQISKGVKKQGEANFTNYRITLFKGEIAPIISLLQNVESRV